MKLSLEQRLELLEQEYETTRLAVEAGQAKPEDLERIAGRTLEAANVLAIQRGWVLPDFKAFWKS